MAFLIILQIPAGAASITATVDHSTVVCAAISQCVCMAVFFFFFKEDQLLGPTYYSVRLGLRLIVDLVLAVHIISQFKKVISINLSTIINFYTPIVEPIVA